MVPTTRSPPSRSPACCCALEDLGPRWMAPTRTSLRRPAHARPPRSSASSSHIFALGLLATPFANHRHPGALVLPGPSPSSPPTRSRSPPLPPPTAKPSTLAQPSAARRRRAPGRHLPRLLQAHAATQPRPRVVLPRRAPATWPLAIPPPRRLTRPGRLFADLFWILAIVTLHFATAGAVMLVRTPSRTRRRLGRRDAERPAFAYLRHVPGRQTVHHGVPGGHRGQSFPPSFLFFSVYSVSSVVNLFGLRRPPKSGPPRMPRPRPAKYLHA